MRWASVVSCLFVVALSSLDNKLYNLIRMFGANPAGYVSNRWYLRVLQRVTCYSYFCVVN